MGRLPTVGGSLWIQRQQEELGNNENVKQSEGRVQQGRVAKSKVSNGKVSKTKKTKDTKEDALNIKVLAKSDQNIGDLVTRASSSQTKKREDLNEEDLGVDENEFSKQKPASHESYTPFKPIIVL